VGRGWLEGPSRETPLSALVHGLKFGPWTFFFFVNLSLISISPNPQFSPGLCSWCAGLNFFANFTDFFVDLWMLSFGQKTTGVHTPPMVVSAVAVRCVPWCRNFLFYPGRFLFTFGIP